MLSATRKALYTAMATCYDWCLLLPDNTGDFWGQNWLWLYTHRGRHRDGSSLGSAPAKARTSGRKLELRELERQTAQRLRALPAVPEVLSSIPSNHMVAHNHL